MPVTMVDEHGILGDNEIIQRIAVVTRGKEVPRWSKRDRIIMRVCMR